MSEIEYADMSGKSRSGTPFHHVRTSDEKVGVYWAIISPVLKALIYFLADVCNKQFDPPPSVRKCPQIFFFKPSHIPSLSEEWFVLSTSLVPESRFREYLGLYRCGFDCGTVT